MSCTPEETHAIEMDEPTYPEVVILQPLDSDGKFVNIEVPGEFICRASDLVRETVDIVCHGADDEPIPLPDIKVDDLQFILDFYARYFAEPFNIPESNEEDPEKWFVLREGNLVANGFPAWAEKMLDDLPLTAEPIPNHGLYKRMFDIRQKAMYIISNKLVTFINLKISSMITGKSSEEIRELFAIKNDFDDVDEFHYEDKVYEIKDPDTREVTRTVTQKIKVWDKITEATAKIVNSIPGN